ncbi:SRPBCC family protein [Acidimangrovimonas sediminis]|uniref:SRPBCC family protein n=1 Tax=Acidimangrovimonas sediminis TaxID=2056283 RepID=UPI000C80D77B|nr:SRPBCC family protein [Acidimangrovimonas sediminis]
MEPALIKTLDPETDLHLTRTIPVPRALVWECWTTPGHLVNFFVPKPHRVTRCEIDLRVGGRFDTTFEVEGREMQNEGVYLELISGEKLVFTDAYSEGWKPAPDPFMTALLLLSDAPGGGTAYTAIARHRTAETAEKHRAMGFHDGWGTVVDQLVDYARGLDAQGPARA